MGVRLSLLTIVTILLSSCASRDKISERYPTEEEYYVRAFKKSVLMGCLNETTDNEFGRNLIRKHNGIGLYTEVAVIFHGGVKFATEKGSSFAEALKPVNYPDVEGKIQGYSSCVDYAFYNEEIDSIAHAKYREHQNGEMQYIYKEANE